MSMFLAVMQYSLWIITERLSNFNKCVRNQWNVNDKCVNEISFLRITEMWTAMIDAAFEQLINFHGSITGFSWTDEFRTRKWRVR